MRIGFGIVSGLLLVAGLLGESIPLIGIGMAGFAFLILTRTQG